MNLSANWPHQNKIKLVNTDRSIEIKPIETQGTKRPKQQSKACKSCRTNCNPYDWRGWAKEIREEHCFKLENQQTTDARSSGKWKSEKQTNLDTS